VTSEALALAARRLGCDLRPIAAFGTPEEALRFEPEGALLFLYGDPRGAEEALRVLQASGVPVAVWNVDDPDYFYRSDLRETVIRVARAADIYLSHTRQLVEEYRQLGVAVHHLPTGARELLSTEPLVAAPPAECEFERDWAFVGTPSKERETFFQRLRAILPPGLSGEVFSGIPPEKAYHVFRKTRVNLAAGQVCEGSGVRTWALTERSWEVPLVGGFLLQDERRDLEEHFARGIEAITFHDVEDCAAKIATYIRDPEARRRVALAAQKRVLAQHRLSHRLAVILRELAGEASQGTRGAVKGSGLHEGSRPASPTRGREPRAVGGRPSADRAPIVVYCERVNNESICGSIIRELSAYYEVRVFGPGWPCPSLREVDATDARFYLELDAVSGNFHRPEGLAALRIPKFAWLVDTHKKPLFHAATAREMDLTFYAMKSWGHVLEGRTSWLPLHCDTAIFHPVEAAREFDIAFVGSQAWRAELIIRLREKYGLRVYVGSTAGPREKSETAAIYARTKLVFNRHVTNDLNFRVFEAMACGRGLLTDAQWNGQYELFEEGTHYALYKDEKDLEAQVLRLLADDHLRARIEREAALHVAAHHSTRARVLQLRNAIEGFLRARALAEPADLLAAQEPQAEGLGRRRWLVVAGDEPATVTMRSYGERIAWALAARGDEVVIARRRRSILPLPAPRAGEPEILELDPGPLPSPLTSTNRALAIAGPLHAALARLAASRGRFDAILGEGPLGALLAQPLAARLDVPFILALESCEVARRANRLTREDLYWAEVEHWAADRAKGTLVPNRDVARAVAEHYRVERCVVLAPRVHLHAALRAPGRFLSALGLRGAPPLLVLASSVGDEVPPEARDGAMVIVAADDGVLLRSRGKDPHLLAREPARGPALAALLATSQGIVATRAQDPRIAEARALGCSLLGPIAGDPPPGGGDLGQLDELLPRRSASSTPKEEPELAVL
jgi:spore maturation protein CgeB